MRSGETLTGWRQRIRFWTALALLRCVMSSPAAAIAAIGKRLAMRLKVTDYTQNPDLNDAISRYYALLQLTFATNIYKLYETPDSQIIKAFNPLAGIQPQPQQAEMAVLDVQCNRCGAKLKVQANLDQPKPLAPGNLAFPADNKLRCPSCGIVSDVTGLRRQLEAQFKKRVV